MPTNLLAPDPAVNQIMSDKLKFVTIKNKAGFIKEVSLHKAKEMLTRGELYPDTYIPYQLTAKELAQVERDEEARLEFHEDEKFMKKAKLAQRAAASEAAANFMKKDKTLEEEIVPMVEDAPLVRRGRPAKTEEKTE